MLSFIIPTPQPDTWRLALLPSAGAVIEDTILVSPSFGVSGVSLERLPTGRLKVSVTLQKAAKMKRGKWSAVVTVGKDNDIAAVYRDIVTIGEEPPDTLSLLKAFTATFEPIELSTLSNRKAPPTM